MQIISWEEKVYAVRCTMDAHKLVDALTANCTAFLLSCILCQSTQCFGVVKSGKDYGYFKGIGTHDEPHQTVALILY